MERLQIGGAVESGFERVREQFERNFTHDIEVGASFSAVVDGRVVADLWGGFCDFDGAGPWQADTLVNVYSTTKGLASAAVAVAVDQGKLDYDAKVVDYWPEFGSHGKHVLSVGQLLSHQGGLCGLRQKLSVADLYDFDKMAKALADAVPLWAPGTAAGYHAITWGYLPGELIRRTTGQTLGQYFRDKVAAPLSADCHIGLPESEHARVSPMIGPNRARPKPGVVPSEPTAELKMPELYPIALQNPVIRPWQDVSSARWRAAEIAAANGQANARGIARIYGALARGGELGGVRIVSEATLARARHLEWGDSPDLVLGRVMRRACGFILNNDQQYGPNEQSFGHSGAGGSVGFADPVAKAGVGYTMNQMQPGLEADTRGGRLIRTLYECLAR